MAWGVFADRARRRRLLGPGVRVRGGARQRLDLGVGQVLRLRAQVAAGQLVHDHRDRAVTGDVGGGAEAVQGDVGGEHQADLDLAEAEHLGQQAGGRGDRPARGTTNPATESFTPFFFVESRVTGMVAAEEEVPRAVK